MAELQREIITKGPPWFGTVFAGAYVALYARFASQWNYLANLYNKLKEVQVRDANLPDESAAMAAWWAGFLEDAEDLHLAAKPMFANTVVYWGTQPAVREMYLKHTVGGEQRLDALLALVGDAISKRKARWQKVAPTDNEARVATPLTEVDAVNTESAFAAQLSAPTLTPK